MSHNSPLYSIIDGLGHATWYSKMPVSRPGTAPFWRNRHIIFRALVALEPLLSLMSRFGAFSARISGDRQTHTHTQTHRTTTVTLAAYARRGLIKWLRAPGVAKRKKNGLGTTVDACARNSVKCPENCSKHVALRMLCKNPE